MKEILYKLSNFENLTKEEIKTAIKDMVEGRATDAQIGAFIIATKMKGESVEEIEGSAEIFRELATKVVVSRPEELVDTCGTGGDMQGTFNVSTITAFVLAGAGVRVAKHGNRSVSSKSGSADLLEYMGAKIDLSPEKVAVMIEELGIGFMFAPIFHPAMKRVLGPRREVGVRSVFNLVGPLSNPAGAKRQLLGVFSERLVDKIARALKGLGCKSAIVVHGKDGIDEVSISSTTKIAQLREGGEVILYEFVPEDVGFKRYPLSSVCVSGVEESAKVAMSVLKGEESPAYYMVLLNAMFGLIVSGITEDKKTALERAKESIHSGKAYEKLTRFVELSQKL
ncbi:anthranilate phosphoribosyltransferase [Hydrogenobacter hydrogenophilus]|uniref:Anthranilate phosphoribosyltransferase n=1 Tax=Hydrogenobacter hydrogenophilus TaxID=35835 RepID=A0A285NWN5_9AQUI|nr:anthranilate phosphoribosyltransferase [Hydrogenobacter hydrogenophilus]SNZ13885.1 anthranilate phosphoribosyltransferase [Hydrogenobacter hydrogenophilus]